MAAGTPLVAARVGGVPETVRDGDNGLLVPGNDVPGLAAGMHKLLSDSGAARHRAERASRDVEKFAWSGIADAYQLQYEVALRTVRR
jgi:glycosyltransferase involved in cell wall biosynthesis